MTAYLWIMLILHLINVLVRAWWIARDEYPKRTRGNELLDLIAGIVFSAWVIYLLTAMETAHG